MSDERLAELRASAEQWEVLTIRESRELLAEVEALRAEASLGAALRAVVDDLKGDDYLTIEREYRVDGPRPLAPIVIDRVRREKSWAEHTDATRRLSALLSALPVVEDAADHREEA